MSGGGSYRLKQLEKNCFKTDAFSLSDVAKESLCRRDSIEEVELFNFRAHSTPELLPFEDRLHNFFFDFGLAHTICPSQVYIHILYYIT